MDAPSDNIGATSPCHDIMQSNNAARKKARVVSHLADASKNRKFGRIISVTNIPVEDAALMAEEDDTLTGPQ